MSNARDSSPTPLRSAFEAWLVRHDGCVYLERDEEDRYTDPETKLAWAAWQASLSEKQDSIAEQLLRKLVDQIQKSAAVDALGHEFTMNQAYITAQVFLRGRP